MAVSRAKAPVKLKKTTAKKAAKKVTAKKTIASPVIKKTAAKKIVVNRTTPKRRGFHSFVSDTLGVLRPGSQFLAIKGYRPRDGGTFDVIMSFRSSYHRVCVESVEILEAMDLGKEWKKVTAKRGPFKGRPPFTKEEFSVAFQDLLEAIRESRDGTNDRGKAIRAAYSVIRDANQQPIEGIEFHKKSEVLHLDGVMIKTTMIEKPPPKKPVESKPMTVAKNYFRDKLPVSKWRHYRLEHGSFVSFQIDNLTFTPDDARILV